MSVIVREKVPRYNNRKTKIYNKDNDTLKENPYSLF